MNRQIWKVPVRPGAAVLLLAAGCASAPTMEKANPPPQGSTWTQNVILSGSYGSGSRQTTTTKGMAQWEGRTMPASIGQPATLIQNEEGCWVAQVAGGKPMFSWSPPICYVYPLHVGKTWSEKRSMRLYQANRTVDYESRWNVVAYESVTVPAGTFNAFKVTYSDTTGVDRTDWFDPELGLFVKSSVSRSAKNPNGPGTLETELVSHTVRR